MLTSKPFVLYFTINIMNTIIINAATTNAAYISCVCVISEYTNLLFCTL